MTVWSHIFSDAQAAKTQGKSYMECCCVSPHERRKFSATNNLRCNKGLIKNFYHYYLISERVRTLSLQLGSI